MSGETSLDGGNQSTATNQPAHTVTPLVQPEALRPQVVEKKQSSASHTVKESAPPPTKPQQQPQQPQQPQQQLAPPERPHSAPGVPYAKRYGGSTHGGRAYVTERRFWSMPSFWELKIVDWPIGSGLQTVQRVLPMDVSREKVQLLAAFPSILHYIRTRAGAEWIDVNASVTPAIISISAGNIEALRLTDEMLLQWLLHYDELTRMWALFVCPAHLAGFMLGKSAGDLKEIERETGTKVVVAQRDSYALYVSFFVCSPTYEGSSAACQLLYQRAAMQMEAMGPDFKTALESAWLRSAVTTNGHAPAGYQQQQLHVQYQQQTSQVKQQPPHVPQQRQHASMNGHAAPASAPVAEEGLKEPAHQGHEEGKGDQQQEQDEQEHAQEQPQGKDDDVVVEAVNGKAGVAEVQGNGLKKGDAGDAGGKGPYMNGYHSHPPEHSPPRNRDKKGPTEKESTAAIPIITAKQSEHIEAARSAALAEVASTS